MPDTVRERIIQNRIAVLDAAGKPTGLTIHRYRALSIEQDDLDGAGAIAVYPIQDPKDDRTLGAQPGAQRRLRLRLELRVKGEPPDQVLDPLYSWVVKQMLADTTCGGLARDVEEVGTQWAQDLSNTPLGAAAVDFDIEYWTHLKDPEAELP